MPYVNGKRAGKCFNGKSFNLEKYHTICFSTKKNITTPYILNGYLLDRAFHHSYLGVILSEYLKWGKHIARISSSAKQTLGVISHQKEF